MILRRTRLAASLRPGEAVLSIPAFPALGTADFTAPAVPAGGEIAPGLGSGLGLGLGLGLGVGLEIAGGEIARSTLTLAALTLTRRDRALGPYPSRPHPHQARWRARPLP